MVFEGLEGSKLLILMGMGALFALAGLFLMFRPRQTGDQTRIEAFGLKINAASGGVLVFLIGAVFLAAPVFVLERSEILQPRTADPQDQNRSPVSTDGDVESPSGLKAVVLPAAADAAEQEPNDSLHEANQIERGFFYSGEINPKKNDNEDWFVVPTSNVDNTDIEVQVRAIDYSDGSPDCVVAAFDDKEKLLMEWDFAERGASSYSDVFVETSQFVLVRIDSDLGFGSNYRASCKYELKVH